VIPVNDYGSLSNTTVYLDIMICVFVLFGLKIA